MFPSQDNELTRSTHIPTPIRKFNFCPRFNISRRKHLFTVKLLGSPMSHETYIWEEFQLEIMSFTRKRHHWILGFFGIAWIAYGLLMDWQSRQSAVSPLSFRHNQPEVTHLWGGFELKSRES